MTVRKVLVVSPACLMVGVFFLAPMVVLFLYSLGHSSIYALTFGHTINNYKHVLDTGRPADAGVAFDVDGARSPASAASCWPTRSCTRSPSGRLRRYNHQALFLVLLSLFAAYIVRIYAWRTILGRDGIINQALTSIGVIDHPLDILLYSRTAVILTLINVTMPLAILPLYAALQGVDGELISAAQSLGATPRRAFRQVTLPLSARGIRVGFALCCIGAAGDYVTPQLVGDPPSQLAGNAIADQFGVNFDWATGGALAFTLVLAVAACVLTMFFVLNRAGVRETP